MTTFQGPPPQSRRAARESERAAQGTPPGAEYSPFVVPAESTPESAASEQELLAEREQHESAAPRPAGRRAQRPEGGPEAEPQVALVSEQPASDEPNVETDSVQHSDASEATSDDDSPYRLRDFSPEGRRAAQSPSTQAAGLDYRAEAAPTPSPWQPPIVDAPPLEEPQAASPRPLTRRELRALEQQRAEAAAALVEPPAEAPNATALSNAIAEFEALTKSGMTGSIPIQAPAAPPAPVADRPVADPPAADPFVELGIAPTDDDLVRFPPPVTAPVTLADNDEWHTVEAPPELHEIPDAAEPAAFPFALQSSAAPVETPAEPAAQSANPETDEVPVWARETQPWSPAENEEPVVAEAEAEAENGSGEPHVTRESYTPPPGHWSRQAEIDDDLPHESTMTREVGASNLATTTSALILPSIPQSDFSTLINGTGEILITGTIELPSSLGTMGADARHFDNPDVDHMFDAFDKELVSNDSQPVRAIRAVSTHTASRGIIQINTKPPTNRLTTVAIVVASVLAAGVVGLLAFFIINNLG